MQMKRRNSFDISKEVYNLLLKEDELSINVIAKRLNSEWRTILSVLEFFSYIDLVKEKKKKRIPRDERLFSLK